MHYLALCCIAKDEDPFLKEWLAYHALLGVEHFYVYDNCSRTPIKEVLGPFADPSRVTIRRVMGGRMQIPAYDDCLHSFGGQCKWIGFIDLDEFALPMQDDDLRVFLSEFEAYGGLAATWHLFGPSGHLGRPRGPVIRHYTQAFASQESHQMKCFVQPEKTACAANPHFFLHHPGHFCVNEDHYPVSPELQCTFARGKRIRINHYFTRSQQDFEIKISRGRATTDNPDDLYQMVMFYQSAKKAWKDDTAIHRFLPGLEEALRNDVLPRAAHSLPPALSYEDRMALAMKALDDGNHARALACLCSPAPEDAAKADFWNLRALAAQGAGQNARAEFFVRQSLIREATQTGYTLLRLLLLTKGRHDQAEGIATILRRYPERFP